MNVTPRLKQFIKTLLPDSLRSQCHLDDLFSHPIVRSGLFAGMKYSCESVGSSLTPKLIGCYEKELSPIMERIITNNPRVVFDVGAAEGYYAVGLLTRIPECRVLAFETTAKGRELLSGLAHDNGVLDRIEILGHCTPELFREKCALLKPEYIIMDIEGGEGGLLSTDLADLVRNSEILVEVHPGFIPGVDALVSSAMGKTHKVYAIHSERRLLSDYWKRLGALPMMLCGRTLLAFMDENRGSTSYWLHLVPRKG